MKKYRRNFSKISSLFWASCIFAGSGFSSLMANETVQTGRYLLTDNRPTDEQQDLFLAQIDINFPSSVVTVKQAYAMLLGRSGFRLADSVHSDPAQQILLSQPLPLVHRKLGPMTLRDALKTLAGKTYILIEDPVHRLVSFHLRDEYRQYVTGDL
jgi:conjugative transfer region protein (TIGR03748 family)